MIKQLTKIGLLIAILLFSINSIYGQDEKSFKLTLYSQFNNQKSVLDLTSFVYTIGKDPTNGVAKPLTNTENIFLSLSGAMPVDYACLKMFETKTQSINGFIEIVDLSGKLPTRKIEFNNATYFLTESFSAVSYGDISNFSLNIYTTDLVIDGISIFKN
ncbi:hypothetical protein [Flavobacterium muglaense]|uniref:Uncharacterized protein n=1 Tax=Flavobacterium muglaense TaxID=2764716 RepID=A0A923N0K3_9FLAO|nr:hypothetical protein [Flavobacterium muglaense]MBC5838282.1 hypothetical protein [Flavobacterium muglaense]MBC5844817.1 hypothetical protein [Flavobacterium muglaense]